MPSTKRLALVAAATPVLAKQLTKMWPLLLESKNREKLIEVGKDLASHSPRKRIEGRIEVTAALADTVATNATDSEEKELATDWARRARNLTIRLDMPIHDRKVRKSHRHSVQAQLDKLQNEMNNYLEQ